MSKEALAKVVQRAISDAGFRRQLNSDPAGALRGFDLSADELSALRTGNAGRLSTLGIDQRMSKAFAIGGAVGATRMAQSDLNAGSATVVDDTSGIGGKTAIPADPDRAITADVDGGTGGTTGTVRAGDDYKFAGRVAPEGASTVRVGDDWKFADRAQGSVAPVDGSPEATAADIAEASGGGMANYPAHGGLAGPSSVESARAGDDWKFARSADASVAANANADLSGGTRGDGTAFVDESEGYLTKGSYDASAATSAVTDAHDRAGDNIVTRIDDDASDSSGTSATSGGEPHTSI